MKAYEILQEIISNDLLDDRREYSINELRAAYGIGLLEANDLRMMIKNECENKRISASGLNIQAYAALKLESYQLDSDIGADSMPCDSECGRDCMKAIDAASALLECHRAAFGKDKENIARAIISACENIVGCYICG
jgi:hypothetical protein